MGVVKIEDIQTRLEECDDPNVPAHFYSFGQFLLGEVQRQTEHLDTKLLLVLGWNVGLVAFVLIGHDGWLPASTRIPGATALMIIALAASLFSMLASYLGAKPTDVEWPSQEDWFSEAIFERPEIAKKHYVMCMLSAHQRHEQMNRDKALHLKAAVNLLVLAAILVTAFSLLGLLLRLLAGDSGGAPAG
jgi:hypothetical protein